MRMTNEELVAEYQNGNEKVFDELLASNNGIIHSVINKWFFALQKNGIAEDEMKNEGIYAFWLAIKEYDDTKGCSFSTHAYNRISWHFGRMVDKYCRKSQNGNTIQIVSLDEVIPGTDDFTISDTLADESAEEDFEKLVDELSNKSLHEDLIDLLNEVLSPQEKDIVLKRYGVGCKPISQFELSRNYGVSNSRISEIERNSIRKLKKSPLTKYLSKKYHRNLDNENIVKHSETIKQVKASQANLDDALNYFGF